MSLFGTMKTAVSGMNAQANRLGTVGDNIANANTTGYKAASTAFSSLVLGSNSGSYNSGGVDTQVKYAISQQGAPQATQSDTDLAILGDGFFVVQDTAGNIFLTRSGSFVPNDQGFLVNSAGFTLLGYEYNGVPPTTVVNSYDGLVPVRVSTDGLTATASTQGSVKGNLNVAAPVAPVSANDGAAGTVVDQISILKSSVTGYDPLGNSVQYDFYFSKTGDGEWDVAVYDASNSTNGTFPYTPATPIAESTLSYDEFGKMTTDPATIVIDDTDNNTTITMDLSSMTQLGSASVVNTGTINGNAAEAVNSISIGADGTVSATYAKSQPRPLFRIPLADVASPDNLSVLSGNVFQTSNDSGVVTLGFAGTTGFGSIQSRQLETSNVDIANELTEMIQAQRSYTANSKVFQTGSDLMDVLINLAR